MPISIEARNLHYSTNQVEHLKNIHLRVDKGECYGVVGPNGAGKSLLMDLIACQRKPQKGELFITGLNARENSRKIRSRISYVTQQPNFDPDFSVLENLMSYAVFFGYSYNEGKAQARESLRKVKLEDLDEEIVDSLSPSQAKKLQLARALITEPKLLLLDEPTAGCDPEAKSVIHEIILNYVDSGKTVFLSTDQLSEAESLCNRLILLENGSRLIEGVPDKLVVEHIGKEVVEFSVNSADLDYYLKKVSNKYNYQILNNRIRLFIAPEQDSRAAMNLISSELIQLRRSTLDDVFLKLAGYEVRKAGRGTYT